MKKASLIFQIVLSTHLLFAQANCTLPKITAQPVATISDCAGGAISLAVKVESTSAVIYEWKKDDMPFLNHNSPDLFLTPLTVSDAGSYQVKVTNSCGEVFSTLSKVNVISNSTPNVALVSDKTAICEQESILLTAFPMNGGSNPLFTFRDGLNIVGSENQTSNSLNISNLTPGEHAISVEMKSNASCIVGPSSVTNSIVVNVDAIPAIPNIGQDKVICSDCYQLNAGISSNSKYTWSATNNAIISATDGSGNATVCNIPKNSSTTVTCFVQSKLGLCPSTSSKAIISRVGDITDPSSVSQQSKTIGINDPAPFLVSPLPVPLEIGTWKAISPATITTNGQTENLQIGKNVFSYTISNMCGSHSAEVVITVDPTLGAEIKDNVENSIFTISTDPIENETCITLKTLQKAIYRVVDLNGSVKSESDLFVNEKTRIDKNLLCGFYVIQITINDKVYSRKFTIK